jgi:hypothetical protein
MLRFDGFCAAALADDFFLIFDFGEEFDDVVGILLEVFRFAINGRFQDRSGHAAPSQTNDHRDLVYKKEEERFAIGALRKKKSAGERRRRRGKISERRGTKSAERHAECGSRAPAFHTAVEVQNDAVSRIVSQTGTQSPF